MKKAFSVIIAPEFDTHAQKLMIIYNGIYVRLILKMLKILESAIYVPAAKQGI